MSYTTDSMLNALITSTGQYAGPNAVLDQQVQYQLENWLIQNTNLNLPGEITDNGKSVNPIDQIVDFNASNNAPIHFKDNGTSVKVIIEDPTNTDLVLSGSKSIFVAMGDGNDTLILSDTGNDTVYAGSGNDSIIGGAGADQIYGGTGADTLMAGTGDNILEAGSGAGQYLVGGDNTAGTQLIYDDQSGSDTLSAGSKGGTHEIIGFGSDTLYGGTGPDTLEITGGPSGSHAYLQSGSVADARGDRGDGRVGAGDHGADRGHGWPDRGHGDADGGHGRPDRGHGDKDGGHGRPDRGGGNDLISHSIVGDHDTLQGGAGNDTLVGGAGADTLLAGTGNNVLEAGSGAGQNLVGGDDTAGTQLIYDGQSGSDTLSAGSEGGTHEIIGFGSDTLYGGTGPDTLEITGGPSGSHAYLQSGSVAGGRTDHDDGRGGAGDYGADRGHGDPDGGYGRLDRGGGNELISNSIAGDHDTLQGGAGNDTLRGGAGADTLIAGTGHNLLQAGSGDQTLMDGSAADTMTGGSGDDLFQVQAGANHDDTINAGCGSDTIDFSSQSTSDISGEFNTGGNDWTITFTDGQVVKDNGVLNLSFTDDPNYHI